MMFYVNDQFYAVEDIEKQFEIYESLPHLRECNNRRLAICTDDTFQYIALCLYIREKGGSVVPIHSATPKEELCGLLLQQVVICCCSNRLILSLNYQIIAITKRAY